MAFLRKTAKREPLPVTMSGVRMGERLLQVGIDDSAAAGAIAAKVGLSGSAVIAVADDAGAAQARSMSESAGALVDIQVTPLTALPFADHSFDVVVVHGMRGVLVTADASVRTQALRECHRVLRPGGRIITFEPGPRSGLSALLRPGPKVDEAYAAAGGAVSALEAAGFRPVRVVGALDGYTFTEGLRSL